MKDVIEAEKILFNGLRKYPIIVHKNFTLFHAGGRGDDYFDIDRLTCDPVMQMALIDLFTDKIDKMAAEGLEFDKLAFIHKDSGPTGAIVLASAISQEFEKEIVILRPWKKLRFTHVRIKGCINGNNEYPLKKNDRVLLIDDVITTGATQLKAIELAEKLGAKITGIVSAFVRDETVIENIKRRNGIKFIDRVYTYDQLLYLGYIIPTTRDLLQNDFISELANNVIPELDLLNEADNHDVKDAFKDLNDSLDQFIDQILKDNNLEADDTIRRGLKNLYFSNLSKYVQSSGVFDGQ